MYRRGSGSSVRTRVGTSAGCTTGALTLAVERSADLAATAVPPRVGDGAVAFPCGTSASTLTGPFTISALPSTVSTMDGDLSMTVAEGAAGTETAAAISNAGRP